MATAKTKTKPKTNTRVKTDDLQGKVKNVALQAVNLAKINAAVAVASTKALAGGLKTIGAENVADSRKAVEVLAGDFKAIAKVETLAELARLQGEQTKRSIGAVKTVATRNVADLRQLVAGTVAPMVTARVKANFELFRKAA